MRQKETFLRKRNKELRGCFVGKLESSQHFFYYHLLRNREAEKKKGLEASGCRKISRLKKLVESNASHVQYICVESKKNVKIRYPHFNPSYKLSHDENIEKELSLSPLTHK